VISGKVLLQEIPTADIEPLPADNTIAPLLIPREAGDASESEDGQAATASPRSEQLSTYAQDIYSAQDQAPVGANILV
jgi:hypothetical protein